MIEIQTATVRDFLRALLPTEPHFPGPEYYFRGQDNSAWGLVPTSRRAKTWLPFGGAAALGLKVSKQLVTSSDPDLLHAETAVLDTLTQIVRRIGLAPHLANDAARHAFARHIGLPTRLIDWTRSPLTAAYFAAAGAAKVHAKPGQLAVYAMSNLYLQHSHRMEGVEMLSVFAAENPNLLAQRGVLFKLSGECADLLAGVPVERRELGHRPTAEEGAAIDNQLLRVTLPWARSIELLETLRRQEIHAATVYPGQHGVAELVREVFISDAGRRPPAPRRSGRTRSATSKRSSVFTGAAKSAKASSKAPASKPRRSR